MKIKLLRRTKIKLATARKGKKGFIFLDVAIRSNYIINIAFVLNFYPKAFLTIVPLCMIKQVLRARNKNLYGTKVF